MGGIPDIVGSEGALLYSACVQRTQREDITKMRGSFISVSDTCVRSTNSLCLEIGVAKDSARPLMTGFLRA